MPEDVGAATETESSIPTGERIATLDVIRGVAVMGILAMNIIAFAMPEEAYLNPVVVGWNGPADRISWLVSFIFIDGRMRGLFSFLFGASMLLVIERADAAGLPSANIHFRRMAWLLLFGFAHYLLIWWGDILALYAIVGMLAWFFHSHPPKRLIVAGLCLIVIQCLIWIGVTVDAMLVRAAAEAPAAQPADLMAWSDYRAQFEPNSEWIARMLEVHRGGYADIVAQRARDFSFQFVGELMLFGVETLGYMLLGMAALKAGFLSGGWHAQAYRWIAGMGFAVGVPLYAWLAARLVDGGFTTIAIIAYSLSATTLLRPIMIIATAALVILLARRRGAISARFAAAGRAAFTNYLGTSIVMTTLFYGYGFGLYGYLSRAELWLVILPAWLLMLLWSKPWLDRFLYGPFEWLWRSLSRGKMQPMRR